MARGDWILPSDLPLALQRIEADTPKPLPPRPTGATRAETVEDAEREYLVSLLRENAGNVAQSARQAGISRQGLHKLLNKHGVDAGDFRP
jgi:two-component system response regulator HydG